MASFIKCIIGIIFLSSVGLSREKLTPEAKDALNKLKLPGIKLNLKEWSVDVLADVCLLEGVLELILCTDNSKEHESIFCTSARPLHIHTALLLMGSKPGNPAMKRVHQKKGVRWVSVDPTGDEIIVSVVFSNEDGMIREYPISDFVSPVAPQSEAVVAKEKKRFPDNFIFAGSHLIAGTKGFKKYLCEDTGNVISVSTFGDELLCLSELSGHESDKLNWKVNSKLLPDLGKEVIIRLRSKVVRPVKKQKISK
ncbi:MAG: YdjY domain-containing protein [Verrucomicrobiales bacterium]|nr:YdjY domain-containing protein [Verrucomicrobiales bacterium]